MSTSWSRLQAWRQERGVSSRAAAICAGGWLECLWAGGAWRRGGLYDIRMIARFRSRPRNVQLAGMCCIHRSDNLDFMLRCLIVDDNSRFLAAARCWLEREEM